jgi:hypothetical protein
MGRTRPDPTRIASPLRRLSLCAPLPCGPRRLHGPMCQSPVFPLSHSPLRGTWPSAPHGFPPISPLCASSVLATRASPAQFQPCAATPSSGQACPAAFPRRTARGTGWSSLRPLPRHFRLSPVCAVAATAMLGTHHTTTSNLQHAASCRMPCSPPSCRIATYIATTWRAPFTAWEPLPSIPPPPARTTARGQGCQLRVRATQSMCH